MPTLVQLFHLLSDMQSWIPISVTAQLDQGKFTIPSLKGIRVPLDGESDTQCVSLLAEEKGNKHLPALRGRNGNAPVEVSVSAATP